MKERPILFSAPMVRAVLAGTKTQTRRAVKPMRSQDWLTPDAIMRSPRAKPVIIEGEQWAQFVHPMAGLLVNGIQHDEWSPLTCIRSPYGQPGDRLWVRETWQGPLMDAESMENEYRDNPVKFHLPEFCEYAADGGAAPEFMTLDDELVCRWRPSIHMPRWASRINLEITGVRVERLQDISEVDVLAEGVQRWPLGYRVEITGEPKHESRSFDVAQHAYRWLWESINGPGSWDANPWVWVIEFKRI